MNKNLKILTFACIFMFFVNTDVLGFSSEKDLEFFQNSTNLRVLVKKPGIKQTSSKALVLLHGLSDNPLGFFKNSMLHQYGGFRHFTLYLPIGASDKKGRHDLKGWDAGNCCIEDPSQTQNLKSFLREISLRHEHVFIVGYSNGGHMAHRMACELDRSILSGVVSIAGTTRFLPDIKEDPNRLKSAIKIQKNNYDRKHNS